MKIESIDIRKIEGGCLVTLEDKKYNNKEYFFDDIKEIQKFVYEILIKGWKI